MSKSKEQFMEQREQDQATEPAIPTVHHNTDLSVPKAFNIANKEVNKATIIAKRTEDVKHVIAGIEDKAGYKKAIELRAEYRTLRTSLEKHRKTISQPINQYLSDLKKATDDLGKEALVGEEYFDTLITEIDNEKLRIENEKKEAKAKLLKERVALLIACNGIFDGEVYHFGYAPQLNAPLTWVEVRDEEGWDKYTSELNKAWATEQARIKQKEADDAKELERLNNIAAEQEAEAQRLQDKRTSLRVKELTLMGAIDTVQMEIIESVDDEKWDALIEALNKAKEPVGIPMHDVVINEPVTTAKNELVNQLNQVTPQSYVEFVDKYLNINNTPSESDYSLNEFEKFVEEYTKNKKTKESILLAIKEYKQLMDNM